MSSGDDVDMRFWGMLFVIALIAVPIFCVKRQKEGERQAEKAQEARPFIEEVLPNGTGVDSVEYGSDAFTKVDDKAAKRFLDFFGHFQGPYFGIHLVDKEGQVQFGGLVDPIPAEHRAPDFASARTLVVVKVQFRKSVQTHRGAGPNNANLYDSYLTLIDIKTKKVSPTVHEITFGGPPDNTEHLLRIMIR